VTRGDLTSRSITLYIPPISEEQRLREQAFYSELGKVQGEIMGAICNGIANALKTQNSFELSENFRMADSWHWVTAAEPAFGWDRGSVIEAFRNNQLRANDIVLNSSPLYPYIRKLADVGWTGTPSDLLSKLNSMKTSYEPGNSWPTNPRGLTDRLRRLSPALKLSGIKVQLGKTSGTGSERFVKIGKIEHSSDANVAPETLKGDAGDAENGGSSSNKTEEFNFGEEQ
jgi:hypothetical protein